MRIIGYEDPRALDKLSEWNELKKYPHFCVSQTLVQGLSRKYGRTEFGILTTIDKLIKELYKDWTDNSPKEIKQFLEIRKEIENISNGDLRKAFFENRMEVYKSIKFLLECEITSKELEKNELSKEKKEFLNLYKKIEESLEWKEIYEINNKTKDALIESIRQILIEEIDKEIFKKKSKVDEELKDINIKILEEQEVYVYTDKLIRYISENEKGRNSRIFKERLLNYNEVLKSLNSDTIKKVILHGVHQFTPIILKLIEFLEKNNIEVVFLINYNTKFKKTYETWEKVYSWRNENIEVNQIEEEYEHRAIANNYGAMVEGKLAEIREVKNIVIEKFDNYTEMSNYIAEKYTEAKEALEEDNKKPEYILGNMYEQFYSVDGSKINDMLKVYFPEQFERKHFLSYPIGQLILALYNLWDEDNKIIKMNQKYIKEALGTKIWRKSKNGEVYNAIEIFENIQVYFSDLENKGIEEYLKRISSLKKKIENINSKPESSKIDYHRLSYFNMEIEEVEFFEQIVEDINIILDQLMGHGNEINMIDHYKELMKVISDKIEKNKEDNIKAEIQFVKEIKERLETIDSNQKESIGAIKETLHFYLAQNSNDDSSKWIVRDFNQIDGGVLLADGRAKERSVKEVKSIYHLMEVSDMNMLGKSRSELSWPLTKEFIDVDNRFIKIILESKGEFKNYLRYMLFYALYYIEEKEIKISYIENSDNNMKEELFYILKMMNIKEEPATILNNINFKKKENRIQSTESIEINKITGKDVMNLHYCEIRFLYESLIEKNGVYKNEFLIKHYLKNLIAINSYESKESKFTVEEIIKKIAEYMKDIEIKDLKFDVDQKVEEIGRYNSGNEIGNKYKEIIKEHIYAIFSSTNSEEEKEQVERLMAYKIDEKNSVLSYMRGNNNIENIEMKEKCMYCKYREMCAK